MKKCLTKAYKNLIAMEFAPPLKLPLKILLRSNVYVFDTIYINILYLILYLYYNIVFWDY